MQKKLFILLFICITGTASAQTERSDIRERWRLGVSGGLGHMYASSKDAENELVANGIDRQKARDFYKNYKSGWQGNADLHYLLNPYMGVGAKYALFSTSATLKQISFGNYNGDGFHEFFGNMDNQLYINYVGPSFMGQYFINRRKTWKTTALVSYGYAHYRLEERVMEFPMLATGHTFGGYSELGIEYYLGRHIAIGVNLHFFTGIFRKFELKNNQNSQTIKLSWDERENVSRTDFSFGIRFYN